MVTAMATVVAALSAPDRRAVELYAAGQDIDRIAAQLRIPPTEVEAALDRAGVATPADARQWVGAYRQRAETVAAATGRPAKPGTESGTESAVELAVVSAAPAVDNPITAMPATAMPGTDVAAPGGVFELLARAAASDQARIRTLAERIRTQLDDLRQRLDAEARERQLTGTIGELEAQLAKARAELRAVRTGTTQAPTRADAPALPATSAPPVDTLVDAKAVRAWAAQAGVDCNPHGRLPGRVLAAYRAAHAGGAR